jgi:hypothetical protein
MDGGKLAVDQPFDAVIGRHSVQFLPGWPEPLKGFRAALRIGGRLSFMVWGPATDNPYTAMPLMVASEHGWLSRDDVAAATPFSLGDADRIANDMKSNGFSDVDVEPVRFEVRLPRDAALANRVRSPMFTATAKALSPKDRVAYEQALAAALERDTDGDRVVARGLTLIASGTA